MADASYRGDLVGWIEREFGWTVQIVTNLAETVGFTVQSRGWVIERTFAWLGKYRRLARDCEWQLDTSESLICAAMVHFLVRRLTNR